MTIEGVRGVWLGWELGGVKKNVVCYYSNASLFHSSFSAAGTSTSHNTAVSSSFGLIIAQGKGVGSTTVHEMV